MDKPEPTREHQWLSRLAGDWTFEVTAKGPEGEMSSTGTERMRMLGDFWLVAEGEGEMQGGGTASSLMTLGYDPQKERFTGTFHSSMMTNLWLYDGALDGNRLVLETIGPGMTGEGTSRYRDIIEVVSDDERLMTSETEGPDGTWTRFMTMTCRRAK